jgi:beta-galactosidase/beta-glucuronidase
MEADRPHEVNITVHTSTGSAQNIHIEVQDESERVVAVSDGQSDSSRTFNVPNPSLWGPGHPSLYNVTVTLENGDSVTTYTGFRSIGKGSVNGIVRPLLNGEFIYAFGPLEYVPSSSQISVSRRLIVVCSQGYWPDGLYTPPTYEAMIYDLQIIQSLGFNMLRKHIKVEPDLFYRACDEMGLLVMQDMPSLRADDNKANNQGMSIFHDSEPNQLKSEVEQIEFARQLEEVVNTHKSFPSIYTWVVFNEAWGQWAADPAPEFALTDLVKSLDPTRLVNSVTGWHDHGAGDYSDNHHVG